MSYISQRVFHLLHRAQCLLAALHSVSCSRIIRRKKYKHYLLSAGLRKTLLEITMPTHSHAPKELVMDGRMDKSLSITACPEVKQQRATTWQRGPSSECCPSIKVVWEGGVQPLCFLLPLVDKLVSVPPAGCDFTLSARSM